MSFEEQIMSKDKYNVSEHVFVANGGYCVNYPSNIFHNMCSFENWGILLEYPPVLAGAYSVM